MNNSTLRLVVSNMLDSVFVWSIPLGGTKSYSDGTCPCTLDATLTGESNSQFGASVAISETGKTLVVGVPGSSGATDDGAVLLVDIAPAKQSPAPAPATSGPSGALSSSQAANVALDSSYFVTNPSTVIISPRRGTVGVPAAQSFNLNSWAAGSPGGAAYDSSSAGYSIAPQNPYQSGGTSVQSTMITVTSALKGLGLTTSVLKNAAAMIKAAAASSGGGKTYAAGGLVAGRRK